jgi:hypothetical protein
MADNTTIQPYGLRQARARALRIATAYASIRELNEVEFCKLVDDLTIASVARAPGAADPPVPVATAESS